MNVVHPIGARIVEAGVHVVPGPGMSLDEALKQMDPHGHLRIDRHADGTATVVLYEEQEASA